MSLKFNIAHPTLYLTSVLQSSIYLNSINWNEDGNFININRSNYNRDENKLYQGRIEEFRHSDLIIDQTF